jgi:O-antigen/teichoic acid export membrane protein
MQIGRQDVLWNYAATFLQIAAQVLLFPFVLRTLPRETVAVWMIFSTIIALVNLLDFGFNPSFARNVTYVFSGAKILKPTGFDRVEENAEVDYSLLKGLIGAMRRFYSRMAAALLLLLITLGTYYLYTILKTYRENHIEVYTAWAVLCVINVYSFYTLYYDALLLGKGLIKQSKQIGVVSQCSYLTAAVILITAGFGLTAVVSAQALAIIIRRVLAHRTFYSAEINKKLRDAAVWEDQKAILKAVYPNAVKVGLTGIGSFLVSRSAVIVGSLYLPLDTMASYGITVQIAAVIGAVAGVYFFTYQPKIVQYRIHNNISAIKQIYIKNCLVLFMVYIFFGVCAIFWGGWALGVIGSKTPLLSRTCIIVMIIISLLESNHGIAGGVLATKNEIPYFKAALISGSFTVVLLLFFMQFMKIGVWGMILAPGISQACYNNWKWPLEVYKGFKS